ncbi:MAG: NAD(P)-dependent oxidoreductase [Gammaproteobacteria bacterium]|nr:NAD(P)-dependent oxidoreductase [Gammaproteobacteria bacterium]
MSTRRASVGVLGLGAMGAPMARNLHAAGMLGAVWNRTHATAEALAAETGVAVAADPADLARRCGVIVTSVSADDDLIEVIEALARGVTPDAVVVDTSTVASETAQRAAARLAEADAQFLDAPVSGGVEGARAGTLAMMVGGPAAALERVRPVLEAVAGRVVHMGPVGAGQATKAVNQIMVAGINQAVTEALAFGEAMGLPLEKVIDVVGGGAAGNWFLTHRGPTMIRGDFPPGFKVALHDKDLSICQQMALRYDVQLPIVSMTRVNYRRLMQSGHGDDDISALYLEKQRLFDESS